ncbi:hypothetical protein PG987_004821 [Apiospora arundinis]
MVRKQHKRDRLCVVLSQLFLDTDLSEDDFTSMASSIQGLDAPRYLIDDVLYHDLFPILATNLVSISGAWTDIDEVWLSREVQYQRSSQQTGINRLWNYCSWLILGWPLKKNTTRLKHALEEMDRHDANLNQRFYLTDYLNLFLLSKIGERFAKKPFGPGVSFQKHRLVDHKNDMLLKQLGGPEREEKVTMGIKWFDPKESSASDQLDDELSSTAPSVSLADDTLDSV